MQSYCYNSQTITQIVELKGYCSASKIFEKRFFHLFNAFWILKYLNFAHETSLSREELHKESVSLLHALGIQTDKEVSNEQLLEIFRKLDKNN